MSHKRKREDKRRLQALYEETKHNYCSGVWYDDNKDRLIKYSAHNPWLKTHSRRTTRRRMKQNEEFFQKGNQYKKYDDYWWDLF